MEKEELRKRLKRAIAQLKSTCNDAKFFDVAMDRILSLKGQLTIEPTLSYIKKDDVLREYKDETGKVTFIETKNEIIVSMNGFRLIVSPWLESLYEHMKYVMDNIEKVEKTPNLPESEKEEIQVIVGSTIFIITDLLTCFNSMGDWLDKAIYCAKTQNERNERLLKEAENPDNLPPDDERENEIFRSGVEAVEYIGKELKEKPLPKL